MKQFYEKFGRRLLLARIEAGLTQEELAKRVNLSRTSITNIEKGKQNIQLHMLFLLAAAVGTSVEELLPNKYSVEEESVIDSSVLREIPKEYQDWVRQVVGKASSDDSEDN